MDDDFTISGEEYAFGGKMIQVNLSVPESVFLTLEESDKDYFRHKLIEQLAAYILDKKYCTVTMMDNPLQGTKELFARCVLMPDEQIKLLRSLNYESVKIR